MRKNIARPNRKIKVVYKIMFDGIYMRLVQCAMWLYAVNIGLCIRSVLFSFSTVLIQYSLRFFFASTTR